MGRTNLWRHRGHGQSVAVSSLSLGLRPEPIRPFPKRWTGWANGFGRAASTRTRLSRVRKSATTTSGGMYGAWDALKNAQEEIPQPPPRMGGVHRGQARIPAAAGRCGPDESGLHGKPRLRGRLRAHKLDDRPPSSRPEVLGWLRRKCVPVEGGLHEIPAPLLGAVPLPLFAQHRKSVYGRTRHQRHPRSAGHGARHADDRHDGRGRGHGRGGVQGQRRPAAGGLREPPAGTASPDAQRRGQAAPQQFAAAGLARGTGR